MMGALASACPPGSSFGFTDGNSIHRFCFFGGGGGGTFFVSSGASSSAFAAAAAPVSSSTTATATATSCGPSSMMVILGAGLAASCPWSTDCLVYRLCTAHSCMAFGFFASLAASATPSGAWWSTTTNLSDLISPRRLVAKNENARFFARHLCVSSAHRLSMSTFRKWSVRTIRIWAQHKKPKTPTSAPSSRVPLLSELDVAFLAVMYTSMPKIDSPQAEDRRGARRSSRGALKCSARPAFSSGRTSFLHSSSDILARRLVGSSHSHGT